MPKRHQNVSYNTSSAAGSLTTDWRVSSVGLSVILISIFFEVSVGGLDEFVIPLAAEASDERPFEETVGPDAVLAAEDFGAFADFPSVEVNGGEAVILTYAHRIKVARHWFHEVDAPFAPGFFEGTHAHAARAVGGEDTVASVDDRSHQVALAVDIGHAVFLDFATGGGQEVVDDGGEHFFELAALVFGDRSAGIAVDAALAEAAVEVAAEIAFDKVKRDESVFYLEHNVVIVLRVVDFVVVTHGIYRSERNEATPMRRS